MLDNKSEKPPKQNDVEFGALIYPEMVIVEALADVELVFPEAMGAEVEGDDVVELPEMLPPSAPSIRSDLIDKAV